MSIAACAHRHVFGIKGDVKDNIGFMDEQTVLYPAGANTVLYNTETKNQKFIPVTEKGECITAMGLSSNRRYLAIGERSAMPHVIVYDLHTLRKRKVLYPAESESKDFVSLAFSSDCKYILTQSGAPDWTLYYWAWEKAKLMASVRTVAFQAQPLSQSQDPQRKESDERLLQAMVHQVAFNPQDPNQISVVGCGIFKIYRQNEGALKLVSGQKFDAKNFTCHAWITDDRIVVGTEEGRILIVQGNGELLFDIKNIHGPNNIMKGVFSIVPYTKGFIAGGAGGSMGMYERFEDAMSVPKDFFRKTKEFSLQDDTVKVVNMAISPSEDSLVLTSENNQIFSVALAGADIKGDDTKCEIFSQTFHHGLVTGMDTCIRKPLIVTCSSDKSVRIWNYLENNSELVKYFSEEAYSVAIHPSGLYILVGFSDKLRLMNLLIDDIRPFREFTIRGCRECRFSDGGQYFAAVHGNTIQIYNTWSFENVANLKGHNGKVRSIHWAADDSKIITAGMDGAIYDWSLKDLMQPNGAGIKRDGEIVTKTTAYSCAITSPDGKTIYAVGSDRTLKEICDSQIVRETESSLILSQVCISHSGRMMFVGTSTGTIRSVKFPLTNDSNDFQEHQAHCAPVSRLRVSFDDQFLFSTSDDGSLYVFKITDKENRTVKREREIVYADEILVTKSDLEEKNQMMNELKTRVEELKMENEYQLRLKDMNFNEKIKEMTEKFMQEIEALKITSTFLRTEKEKEEVRFEEEIAEEKERHSHELVELETVHNFKLMSEYEKYQELQVRASDLQAQWERQMREMQGSQERALADLTAHFDAKLREKQSEMEALQKEMTTQLREFEETSKETEEDADAEIIELKHRYEKKLKEEKEIGLRLKGENGIMRKKFNTLQSEIDAHKTEISKMYAEEKKLHNVIKSLEKDIAGLKKEIQERDETIQDKEKRIYDLKKKNQELEKFKFVLDYKIKELKRQIEPREHDIQGMTKQIKEMDSELQQYYKINNDLELQIADVKLKLKAAEKEVNKERHKVKSCSAIVKRFKNDLSECVQYTQEPRNLKNFLKRLYQKYCQTSFGGFHELEVANEANENEAEADVQAELARQREYLERTITSLRKKVVKDQGAHRQDGVRIMTENVQLIKEINLLRKDIRGAKIRERQSESNTGSFVKSTSLNSSMSRSNASSPNRLPPIPTPQILES